MYKRGVPPYTAMLIIECYALGYGQAETEEERERILETAMNNIERTLNNIGI